MIRNKLNLVSVTAALFIVFTTGIAFASDSKGEYCGYDGQPTSSNTQTPAGSSSTYMIWDDWGGTWCDAEKSPSNTEDDLMCWAAAASNILEWTGWGKIGGMSNSNQMFSYFQDHWTDKGGLMEFGWEWWFDGTYSGPYSSGWSQVDVPGGGFYPTKDFYGDYFHESWSTSQVLFNIDNYLHKGYGTTLGVYSDTIGHAITCWGFDYNPDNPTEYYGIWITDSDDDKIDPTPQDELCYYNINYRDGKWFLQDFYGYNDIYIGGVQALDMVLVPEPTTLLLLGTGSLALLRKRKLG